MRIVFERRKSSDCDLFAFKARTEIIFWLFWWHDSEVRQHLALARKYRKLFVVVSAKKAQKMLLGFILSLNPEL